MAGSVSGFALADAQHRFIPLPRHRNGKNLAQISESRSNPA
jgi:hypothetical protein